MNHDARAWAEGHRVFFEDRLRTLVELPTISMDPGRGPQMEACAEAAVGLIRHFGGTATLLRAGGKPYVHGRFGDPRRPSVLIYNHLDVQPAEEPEWKGDPFRMRIDGERYLGRGTTDDKGPALTCLLAVAHAVRRDSRLGFQLLWEFEEEVGSPHFPELLREQRSVLGEVRAVLVSDTLWVSAEQPSMDVGLRGFQALLLKLRTAEVDAHSGVVGGGAPNPIAGLARVLAACFDASTGGILVPGVRDGVVPVSDAEMDLYVRSGFEVERFRRTYGFRRLLASEPRELLRRLWTEPTFEVHGISGGYQGPGIKSIVPAWAEAKVSLRLVPGQSPAHVVDSIRRFVAELDPLVEVNALGSAPAFVTSVDAPECTAMNRASERVLGKELAVTRGGGSIPAVATMAEALRAPVLLMGLSLPEHGYHAPNEFFDWTQARRGVELYAAWFEELEQLPGRP
ncbi:MAG TPA: M20/M25/M40 family metallo-hydrolase [Myxococcaceae bacterium]|nr:M20/M25/M40 family metallo-hydrolase [Myxococcaceae bacterium]